MGSAKIPGGYYIKARAIQESWISHAPPHVREIWDWLLMKCNHEPRKSSGTVIQRGETVTTYKEMQEALCWYVGYRKQSYKKWHCEIAMKALTKADMITTTKTTRGIRVKVLNYSFYQNPGNYENYTNTDTKTTTNATMYSHYKQELKEERRNRAKQVLPIEVVKSQLREMGYEIVGWESDAELREKYALHIKRDIKRASK